MIFAPIVDVLPVTLSDKATVHSVQRSSLCSSSCWPSCGRSELLLPMKPSSDLNLRLPWASAELSTAARAFWKRIAVRSRRVQIAARLWTHEHGETLWRAWARCASWLGAFDA